ncbi:anti-phage ZorAB system protein ZorA [Marinospirillum insulare]|uniref:MotA/TolQ/ExbB proton channel family protein n=1 Tax=Marinospirillum insulare TaxID=217169 RepID=A0ABQ5ZY65_9GAMM|nr:anti-phage ZorAB system protein ZorA [Marinospirillum insulare]GLR64436.1 hypothetical protein GCM10007878_18740 [Marinospirillum insulare]
MSSGFSWSDIWWALIPTQAVGVVFGLIMVAIFLVYMVFLFRTYFVEKPKRTDQLIDAIEKQNSEKNAFLRYNLKEYFKNKCTDKVIKNLWLDFDQSLVTNTTKTKDYSTIDSKYFFNTTNVFPHLSGSRLIVSIPSMLVAIGVLGTFTGLVLGLNNLEINTDDTVVLKQGIGELISGASIAFNTSVLGVFFSLIASTTERALEKAAHKSVEKINHLLISVFPMAPSEQALLHIKDSSEQSKEALQTLHEKIGSELQKSVSSMSEDFQKSMEHALTKIMEPAINSLVSNTQQQSSQALEDLVTEFMGGMKLAGQEQAQEMNNAAQAVQESMQEISEQLSQSFEGFNSQQSKFLENSAEQQGNYKQQQQELQEDLLEIFEKNQKQNANAQEQYDQLLGNLSSKQSGLLEDLAIHQKAIQEQADLRDQARQEEVKSTIEQLGKEQADLLSEITEYSRNAAEQNRLLIENHKQLTEHLNAAVNGMENSSNSIQATSKSLQLVSANTRSATTEMADALKLLNAGLITTNSENSHLAEILTKQSQSMTLLQTNLLVATTELKKTAETANSGFNQLEEHQKSFLQSLSKELLGSVGMFADQINKMEKQAEHWLSSYSQEVTNQTNERLKEWNNQTFEFTKNMTSAVSAISTLVDEIEQKVEKSA